MAQAAPTAPPTSSVRLNVNLSRTVAEGLAEMARKRGNTVSEEVRRALSLLRFLDEEVEKGANVLLEKDGKFRQILLDLVTRS
jgi:Ribbon-helix-helix protein, copG family